MKIKPEATGKRAVGREMEDSMSTMTIVGRAVEKQRQAKHPVQTTALLYLKDGLGREHYEILPEIVAIASEFGASEGQIREVLWANLPTPSTQRV